jgi:hypothetical protein
MIFLTVLLTAVGQLCRVFRLSSIRGSGEKDRLAARAGMRLTGDRATLDSRRDTNSLIFFQMLVMTGAIYLVSAMCATSRRILGGSPHDTKQPKCGWR